MDKWIRKIWCVYRHTLTHTHTQEYYSVIKTIKSLSFVTVRMYLWVFC